MNRLRHNRDRSGFTLIELLIVIAIILILIAIALPNFLEAQIRAKVVNVNAELRSLESAISSYNIDHRRYPGDGGEIGAHGFSHGSEGNPIVWSQLTTPVKYYGEIPVDNFLSASTAADAGGSNFAERDPTNNVYRYFATRWRCVVSRNDWVRATSSHLAFCRLRPGASGRMWPASPYDPDVNFLGKWIALSAGPDAQHNFGEHAMKPRQARSRQQRIYSPTNGTRSFGDIVKWGS